MKKNGFTLSELIISLVVIGIASAIILPAATKLMPDNNKMKVISLHSKISNTIADLLNDDAIYYTPQNNECEALACTQQARREYANDPSYSGSNKFQNLMIYKLGIDRATSTDPDGVFWTFQGPTGALNAAYYRITIGVNGRQGNIYSPNNTRPDSFRFRIDNYGGVNPDDAMTAAYLKNSFNMNSKEEDLEAAAALYQRYPNYRQ